MIKLNRRKIIAITIFLMVIVYILTNVASICIYSTKDEKCNAVCIVMSKEQVYQMDVGLVNIPVENTCVYGENKCIFFAGTLFAININTLKGKSIPKLQKIFYLDTGIFAVTKKQSR